LYLRYFQTLQLLIIAFLISALLQTQAVMYYRSPEYSDGQEDVPLMLKGSAVCTRHDIVCLDPDCAEIGVANLCHMSQVQAYYDLTMTALFLIQVMVTACVQNKVSNKLDESIQTARDYSILVDDPGPNDTDPEEWRTFFSQFGHVTFVTVALDNGPLIKALVNRRAVMREIIMIIGNGKSSEDGKTFTWEDANGNTLSFQEKLDAEIAKEAGPAGSAKERTRRLIAWTAFFGQKPLKSWKAALEKSNDKINEVLQKAAQREQEYDLDGNPCRPYKASKVFVTFETEVGQRKCLKALSQGIITSALDLGKSRMRVNHPEYLFKDEEGLGNVLAVQEAPEPSEIFWEDVDVTFGKRLKQQSITFSITTFIVIGSVIVCKQLQIGTGPAGAALWISLTNIIIPEIIRNLTFRIEKHVSLNDQQLSLFLKLTFFRWCNTAIVLYLITNFDEFLTEEAMKQVQAVLFADALTTPLIRTLNPLELVNQVIISNYAPTQEKMNSYFFGTPWFAAERYADMTKTLFLALFYSCLFPSGLFLTAFGYAFGYSVDKYSLLRSWRTPAELGDEITKVSRGHMILAVYAHAVMTMIFFAEFPFDNICRNKEAGALDPHKYQEVQKLYNVTNDLIHQRCDQTVTGRVISIFLGGDITRDSMYGKQERVVRFYVYLNIGFTIVMVIAFFGAGVILGCYHLFHGSYSSATSAQGEKFSECGGPDTDGGIQAYIPIVRHLNLQYPCICADVAEFDPSYLAFEIPTDEEIFAEKYHDFVVPDLKGDRIKNIYHVQSLYNEAELPGYEGTDFANLFSTIKHYPPPPGLEELPDEPVKKSRYAKVADDEES